MHQPASSSTRQEPDLRKCRTGRIAACWLKHQPLISHCLHEQDNCKYGMPFAYGCLCKHPHHLQFAAADDEELSG